MKAIWYRNRAIAASLMWLIAFGWTFEYPTTLGLFFLALSAGGAAYLWISYGLMVSRNRGDD